MTTSQSPAPTYDRITIILHWITAALVIVLFAIAEGWGFIPKGNPLVKQLESLHVSLGLVLAAVIVVRLAWRFTKGRRLPPTPGLLGKAATALHHSLYLVLIVQSVLGLVWRWAQAEAFLFFGLFPIQFATVRDRALSHTVGGIHDIIAWVIIAAAGVHAAAALTHHYGLKDDVLKRMLPAQDLQR